MCVLCVLTGWDNSPKKYRYILLMMYVYNRDVSGHLNYEHRVFNSDEFLKTREPAEQLFYKEVNTNSVKQVIFFLLF